MRGEQADANELLAMYTGSPPLARGTEFHTNIKPRDGRITPACAGNRTRTARTTGPAGDHPRLRGEQSFNVSNFNHYSGSPPLARGTEHFVHKTSRYLGITPACAGNSRHAKTCMHKSKDHPRLRGEQLNAESKKLQEQGSPPLARGTGTSKARYCLSFGITPACAGNRPRPIHT